MRTNEKLFAKTVGATWKRKKAKSIQTLSTNLHNPNSTPPLNHLSTELCLFGGEVKEAYFSRLESKKREHSNPKKPRLNETHSFSLQNARVVLGVLVSDENRPATEVSTELCLFPIKPGDLVPDDSSFDPHLPCTSSNLDPFKHYTKKKKQGEKEKGVCTELTLYTDPWKIKKILLASDLNEQQNRFLIPKELVNYHVLSYMTPESLDLIHSNKGLKVQVYDEDTKSKYDMIFKYWKSSKAYVLINGWSQDFAKRRNLKQKDQVGLYLYPYTSKFYFTVLHRSS